MSLSISARDYKTATSRLNNSKSVLTVPLQMTLASSRGYEQIRNLTGGMGVEDAQRLL